MANDELRISQPLTYDIWRDPLFRSSPSLTDDLQQRLARQLFELDAEIDPDTRTAPLPQVFALLRKTEIPFLPCLLAADPLRLHRLTFSTLHHIGMRSVGIGVGLAMHMYFLAALATYPLPPAQELDDRRRFFLANVLSGRWLIANSGPDAHGSPVVAQDRDGAYLIHGAKRFMSLAHVADVMFFTGHLDSGLPCAFVTPLTLSGLRIGAPSFGHRLSDADTHQLRFDDAILPCSALIASGSDLSSMNLFQRSWFQSLIAAPYLGAASRALDLAHSRTSAPGQSDGIGSLSARLGRLMILWRSAMVNSLAAAEDLAAVARDGTARAWNTLEASAAIAKYVGTEAAEHIVAEVRRICGTAAVSSELLSRLSTDIVLGVLHPPRAEHIEETLGSLFFKSRLTSLLP